MAPLNLHDQPDRPMQARTNIQHRFGTPADAAVHVKEALVGHSMPVPEVAMATWAWIGRRESLPANATDHGRGRCKSVCSPMRSHSHAMVQH